ncbi:TlpA family protein disulfide reductase [Puteibacter caeruleilacunae]|nr:TlpA family protein disulfide reductase [Puteibacter caeruleilacunae]
MTKRLFLTLVSCVLLISTSMAQIPKEAFPLTNSLSKLWSNGKTEKAVESSLKLYDLYSPMFIDRIHHTLAQHIKDDPNLYALKYLEQVSLKNNEEVNRIIAPIYLWSRAVNTKEQGGLTKIISELDALLSDNSDYKSNAERYGLLIIQELANKKAIDNKKAEKFTLKIISTLEKYPNIENVVSDRKEAEKRAWHRFLLAYSYDYLYSNVSKKEEYLKKASDYSPDLGDRLNKSAYFYDAALLTGNPRQIGYKGKYKNYLVANNRKDEALKLQSNITFAYPSNENINSLKGMYELTDKNEDFDAYWEKFVDSMGKPVPTVKVQFDGEELDLAQKSKCWRYIDVWGTWCGPCKRELPELQALFVENSTDSNSKLKIYTFSYCSKDLKGFMSKNKYTFPVSEIDKEVNDSFEVAGYPTKILITPSGNYIKIPFGVNWKMYIKNYTLM